MKIIIITDDFYPNIGGVSHTLQNLYNYFEDIEDKLYIFNPFFKNRNVFKKIIIKPYHLNDLCRILKNRYFYFFLAYSIWKIYKAKEILLTHRLKILLALVKNPFEIIWIIENVINLYPYLKILNFDVIMSSKSTILLKLSFILSKIFKKKLITMAHGNDILINDFLSLKSFFFKNVNKIILSNRIMKNLIKKLHQLEDDKLVIINRGISIKDLELKKTKEALRKEYNIPSTQFVLLSVGRLINRKGFNSVIKAVNIISKKRPNLDIKYYLIGEGRNGEELKNLTNKLGLEKKVEFLGKCKLEIKNKFFKLADLFVMPSIINKESIEGFGIVFLEANYYKTPVIGTASGGIREAIIDGETGLLVKPNDLTDLVNKILFLCDNKKLRENMGEIGKKRVLKEYTWENIIKEYKKVFNNL